MAGFHNCPAVILCPPSILPQDNMMANVASLATVHKKDIQYFEQIYHLHLISIVGSISLLAALLFYLHYGIHHYHMGIDLERLVLQNHCPVIYIWECYFPQGHTDRSDFPSFQTVQHLVKVHLLILACG